MRELIFLVGFRAVGKTTVGKMLAANLAYSFVDTDQLVCESSTVEDIVNQGGWELFRSLERDALDRTLTMERSVVATGGGAILHKAFWETLPNGTRIVWLTASKKTIAKRISHDNAGEQLRPSLTGGGVLEEVEEILSEREPLYRRASGVSIDTDKHSLESIVQQITIWLEQN